MWYDKQQLLSHNKILNMVLSNRGGGKTFHCTRWGIDSFIKAKKQTVWVRRYQTEIDEMLLNGKFFDAVREYYPNVDLDIVGNTGTINGEVAFYFVALSKSRQLKSNNYPFVDKIIFDEFLIAEGKTSYLKSEVEVFLDLYETVARTRDNVRAVLLANAITIVNPYFLFFNLKPDPRRRFNVSGQVCVEFFTDQEFIDKKKRTRFGQLVEGTRYGSYAVENQFLLDTDTFIEPKTAKAEFMLGLKHSGIMYGYWVDYEVGLIYVNQQYDPSSRNLYTLFKEDHEPNLLLVKSLSDDTRIRRLIYAFRNGLIRFSDQQVKGAFYEYIGLFVR